MLSTSFARSSYNFRVSVLPSGRVFDQVFLEAGSCETFHKILFNFQKGKTTIEFALIVQFVLDFGLV